MGKQYMMVIQEEDVGMVCGMMPKVGVVEVVGMPSGEMTFIVTPTPKEEVSGTVGTYGTVEGVLDSNVDTSKDIGNDVDRPEGITVT